ncbi:uncharacterized protein AMSG_12419 [Thecamonas trahens ATCC 50062]|uniref:Uncharacterized protein n=1 Tax=Thecamonas trahens ATCC 50062 TaxID=461836 RepID=A0A0L0DU90_THETB|nr:hypothetical protein AMSG_12419 [Thecamonas trahens ATCC 50062]KNC55762.1 hypothetical protein AMSG_12419 [Thecamonas trahens ATCC 50062]|eukprot:XP_013752917.1 hypothetical protein AMSG_12419 [Thecamonas trahens ATCC 50062]
MRCMRCLFEDAHFQLIIYLILSFPAFPVTPWALILTLGLPIECIFLRIWGHGQWREYAANRCSEAPWHLFSSPQSKIESIRFWLVFSLLKIVATALATVYFVHVVCGEPLHLHTAMLHMSPILFFTVFSLPFGWKLFSLDWPQELRTIVSRVAIVGVEDMFELHALSEDNTLDEPLAEKHGGNVRCRFRRVYFRAVLEYMWNSTAPEEGDNGTLVVQRDDRFGGSVETTASDLAHDWWSKTAVYGILRGMVGAVKLWIGNNGFMQSHSTYSACLLNAKATMENDVVYPLNKEIWEDIEFVYMAKDKNLATIRATRFRHHKIDLQVRNQVDPADAKKAGSSPT